MTLAMTLSLRAFTLFVAAAGAAAAASAGSAAASPPTPHILYILIDDWGWNAVGWHTANATEIVTPNLDALHSEGLELDRLYAYKFCSPTRSALQTGRNPIHVNAFNGAIGAFNPEDAVGGFEGIPRNMTGVAAKLKQAGYATHMAGKWHIGAATPDHTPLGRGYDTSLCYFDGFNDYWGQQWIQSCAGSTNVQLTDLWDGAGPAVGQNNSWACSAANHSDGGCVFEDDLFTQRLLDTLDGHDPAVPLFFFFAPHSVHAPQEAPQAYFDKFSFIEWPPRQRYAGQVNYIDTMIGAVVEKLKAKGMYDSTLIVVTADSE